MKMKSLTHEGVTYEFQPPVEIGNHTISSIHQLAAIAISGPNIDSGTLDLCADQVQTLLSKPGEHQLERLNDLLMRRHVVSVQRP